MTDIVETLSSTSSGLITDLGGVITSLFEAIAGIFGGEGEGPSDE